MINDVSSDIYDDENQYCIDCTVKSKIYKHEAFQKVNSLREILKGHADMNLFQYQVSIFESRFEIGCWVLIEVQTNLNRQYLHSF